MPTPTYTPLANITLTGTAASVTFSSISQAYRDLVLVIDATCTSGAGGYNILINNDSGANYNDVSMGGNGSIASSTSSSGSTAIGTSYYVRLTTGRGFNAEINFMDYSATDKHKSVIARYSNSANGADAQVARWASTSAITTIRFGINSSTFAAGSTFALYGIAA